VTHYDLHTRTRNDVYKFVGAFATSKEAYLALAAEVRKADIYSAWICFEGCLIIREWICEHNTVDDAIDWAAAY
jgi:hypothetical protein